MCNESGFEKHSDGWWGNKVVWDLSDEDINDIAAIETGIESGALLYEGLAARGVAGLGGVSLPSGVGAVLGAVLLAYWAWIQWSNSGCGVTIHFYLTSAGFTAVYIESQ